jgi:hypothetical protein
MKLDTIKKLLNIVIILTLVTTLILNFKEIIFLIGNHFKPDSPQVVTNPIVKSLKDIFLFLILMILLFIQFRIKNKIILTLIPFSILIIIYIILSLQNSVFYALSGLRWSIPFFLPFIMINIIKRYDLNIVAIVMTILFCISCIFQIIEFFSDYSIYGFNSFGYPLRVPGIFFIPSTQASFSCAMFCYAIFFINNKYIKYTIIVLTPISIIFTASGSGIITIFILFSCILFTSIYPKRKELLFKLYKVIFPIISIAIVLLLPQITSRSQVLSMSGKSRVDFFLDLLFSSNFISSNFGKYTNTLATIEAYYGLKLGSVVMDSTWGAILGNFGLLGLIFSILALIYWLYKIITLNDIEFFCFSIVTLFFSLTTSITESFPLFLVLSLYFGYFLTKSDILTKMTRNWKNFTNNTKKTLIKQ